MKSLSWGLLLCALLPRPAWAGWLIRCQSSDSPTDYRTADGVYMIYFRAAHSYPQLGECTWFDRDLVGSEPKALCFSEEAPARDALARLRAQGNLVIFNTLPNTTGKCFNVNLAASQDPHQPNPAPDVTMGIGTAPGAPITAPPAQSASTATVDLSVVPIVGSTATAPPASIQPRPAPEFPAKAPAPSPAKSPSPVDFAKVIIAIAFIFSIAFIFLIRRAAAQKPPANQGGGPS